MFMDWIGIRCERNAALKNKIKQKIPYEINLKQKHHSLIIYKWMGWACARGAWGFRMCMMMGWYNRKISEGGKKEGGWGLAGFSTCSLWSRAGGPCFGGLVLWRRALPRPGGTGAPCPPRWRSAQTRPSGWAADCRGRPGRWEPRAHTQTCKHSAPLPPGERAGTLGMHTK